MLPSVIACALAFIGCSHGLRAQSAATPPPQTARQALLEMFLGNGPDPFVRHLPDATRKLLLPSADYPSASAMMNISTLARQMVGQGGKFQTFDDGPAILISEQGPHDKIEVNVEHDSFFGDAEEIELSVHLYHDGRERSLLVIPQLIFTLRQEKNVWRLSEVTASAHVPLSDPAYLHGLVRREQEAIEATAQTRISSILLAEAGYAEQHPDRGYACSLTTLFAPPPEVSGPSEDSGDGAEVQRVYYDPSLANAESNGFTFAISGCEGTPSAKYQLTAIPHGAPPGTKIFCADESGAVRSLEGKNVSECFGSGEVVHSGSDGNDVNQ